MDAQSMPFNRPLSPTTCRRQIPFPSFALRDSLHMKIATLVNFISI